MSEGSPTARGSRFEYRLNPLVELCWRQFGDDLVVFEALSGQTHRMTSMTAAVLMCYEAGLPLSTAALTTDLSADFGITLNAVQVVPLLAVIEQLAALGLINPVTAHVAV